MTKYTVEEIIVYILGFYSLLFWTVGLFVYPSLFRPMGVDGVNRLGGGLVNSNLLAYLSVLLFVLAYRIKIKSLYKYPILFISAIQIYLSYSRGAWAVTFFAFSFWFWKSFKVGRYLFVLVFVILFFTFYTDVSQLLSRGEGIERVYNFSGRAPFWIAMIREYEFSEYSLFGYGFQMLSSEGMGIILEEFGDGHSALTMAHNNILQLFYGTGIFGLALGLSSFLLFLRELKFIKSGRGVNFSVGLVFTVFSFVEFGVFGSPNILILVFNLIQIDVNDKYRSKSIRQFT